MAFHGISRNINININIIYIYTYQYIYIYIYTPLFFHSESQGWKVSSAGEDEFHGTKPWNSSWLSKLQGEAPERNHGNMSISP